MTETRKWIIGGSAGTATLIYAVGLTLALSLSHLHPASVLLLAGIVLILILVMVGLATWLDAHIKQNRVVYVHSRHEGMNERLKAVEDVLAGIMAQFTEPPHMEAADVDEPGVVDMETVRNLKNIEDKLRRNRSE